MIPLENRLLSKTLSSKLDSLLNKPIKNEELKPLLVTLLALNESKSFSKDDLRNLTINSKGELTYLPKGKECILSDCGTYWSKQNRTIGKYGKTFKLFMEQIGLEPTQQSIETLVNLLKSHYSDGTLKVISGQEIAEIYSNPDIATGSGSLSDSCMNEKPYYFFDIYVENCEMLIMLNDAGELRGRAILWNTDDNIKFMDRIYASDSDILVFKEWARDNGYWTKERQNYDDYTLFVNENGECIEKLFNVELSRKYEYYPYMDTFKFTDCDEVSYLTNNEDYNVHTLTETDGNTHVSNRIWDEVNEEYLDEDEAVYVDSINGYTHIDNTVTDYNLTIILESESVSLYGEEYAHEEDLDIVWVSNIGIYAHVEDTFYCDFGYEYYIIDEEEMINLSEHTNGEHDGIIAECNLEKWEAENEWNSEQVEV